MSDPAAISPIQHVRALIAEIEALPRDPGHFEYVVPGKLLLALCARLAELEGGPVPLPSPAADWRSLAQKHIEPWPGAKLLNGAIFVGRHPSLPDVCTISYLPTHPPTAPAGKAVLSALAVDLTDPATAREAAARLALALGAPAQLVEDGVCFCPGECSWSLSAGAAHQWVRIGLGAEPVPDLRPLALALAWAMVKRAQPPAVEETP